MTEQVFRQRHPAHDRDAQQRAQHAQSEDGDVVERHDFGGEQAQFEQLPAQGLGDGAGDEGGDGDGPERADGVGADHQLEGVEGAGQGRVEGAGDRRRRAASHQQAHVAASDPERVPGAGGEGGADLGIRRLQPDRGADAVGDDGLQHDDETAGERHPPAEQRVRLHRIDRAAGIDARDAEGDEAKHEPAQYGDGDGEDGVEPVHGAQALVVADVEQDLVQQLRHGRDQPDGDTRRDPDQGGHHQQPDLIGADHGAQHLRRVRHHRADRSAMPPARRLALPGPEHASPAPGRAGDGGISRLGRHARRPVERGKQSVPYWNLRLARSTGHTHVSP